MWFAPAIIPSPGISWMPAMSWDSLVMEEIPGWQHIGDEDWKQHSLEDLKAMITRDYNRPSIIFVGRKDQ